MCDLMDFIKDAVNSAKRLQKVDVHDDGTPLSFEQAMNLTVNSVYELAGTLRQIVEDASDLLPYTVNEDGSPMSLEQAIILCTELLLMINSRYAEME